MTVLAQDGVDPVTQQGPQPHQRHPVPQQGPQPHQRHPVPQQGPQLADSRWGDPGFWQQVCP
jgi:hypothetical protein